MTETPTVPSADYVSAEAWTVRPGRPDHIDEIADQFERPGAQDFWSGTQAGWPASHRRADDPLRWVERRAG